MSQIASRRQVLIGLTTMAAGAVAAVSTISAQSTKGATTRRRPPALSKSDRKVQIYPASCTQFTELINQRFPGLIDNPNFRGAQSASAIVWHRRGPALLAQNVRWDVTTPSGVFSTLLSKYKKPSRVYSEVEMKSQTSADSEILNSDECMVVTPFFAIRQSGYSGAGSVNWRSIVRTGALQQFLSKELPHATGISPSLDAGVFADYAIAGKDNGRLSKNIQYTKRAEEKLSRALVHRHEKGRTDAGLKKFLRNHATAQLQYTGTMNQRVFASAMKWHAAYLLKLMNKSGRSTAVTAAKASFHPSKFRIVRAAS